MAFSKAACFLAAALPSARAVFALSFAFFAAALFVLFALSFAFLAAALAFSFAFLAASRAFFAAVFALLAAASSCFKVGAFDDFDFVAEDLLGFLAMVVSPIWSCNVFG